MNCRIPLRGALAVLVVAMLAPHASAGKSLAGIPLVWKPTDTTGAGVIDLTGLTDVKIRIEPFVDNRADKAKFGENQEDKVPKPVTTPDSAAEFSARNLTNTLRQLGFSIVAEGGDVVLGGEILEFMVTETNNYKGEVRLKLTVKRGDKPEWTGIAAGTSKRFGRSYKAENYYETISDSLLDAVRSLARDDGFRKAVAGR
jgi:hypothetical protein